MERVATCIFLLLGLTGVLLVWFLMVLLGQLSPVQLHHGYEDGLFYHDHPPVHRYEMAKGQGRKNGSSALQEIQSTYNALMNILVTLLSALRTEECAQRFICEVGWWAGERIDLVWVTVMALEKTPLLGNPLFSSLRDAVLKTKSCECYKCGYLPTKVKAEIT